MDPAKQTGLVTEGDHKVSVQVRQWNALKLAIWRCRYAFDIIQREAKNLVERAAHMEGCPAIKSETEQCLPDCPDRELRLSALVILGAARQFAPVNANKIADGPFMAPSRERYSEIIAELAICQAQLAAIDPALLPAPPPNAPEEKT